MRYLSEIFWRHSWDVPTLVPKNSKFLVCLSVCSLSHFLTKIRLSLDISSSRWAIFFKFSGDIPWMFLHLFKKFQISCMSVSLFIASLPYWYYVNSGYLQFWMSQLSQIFWRHSWDVSTLVPNNIRFLVCLLVCSLPHFLTKITLSLDISSSRWAIFFKFSVGIPGMFLH